MAEFEEEDRATEEMEETTEMVIKGADATLVPLPPAKAVLPALAQVVPLVLYATVVVGVGKLLRPTTVHNPFPYETPDASPLLPLNKVVSLPVQVEPFVL